MADANEKRLASLERRIADLEAFKREMEGARIPLFIAEIALTLREHDKRIKDIISSLFDSKKVFDVYHESLEFIRCDLMRLFEGYYKIFPEREKQDSAFDKQWRSLIPPDKPRSKD